MPPEFKLGFQCCIELFGQCLGAAIESGELKGSQAPAIIDRFRAEIDKLSAERLAELKSRVLVDLARPRS